MTLVTGGDPYLDAGVRGHIVRLAQRNAYKLAGCDVEDLIQEGYLCFAIVKRRYVGKKPGLRSDGTARRPLPAHPDAAARRHFMCLFQRTFMNRIATLKRKQSAQRELLLNDLISEDQTEASAWDRIIPGEDEQATVTSLLRAAPQEVKQLFALMVDDVVRPYRRFGRRRGSARETNNQYYCRLLGLPRGYDLTSVVQNHFVGNTN